MKQMLVHLMLSQRPLETVLVSFFSFILPLSSYYHHSVFRLTHLLCFSYSVDLSGIFFISVIVLFIIVCVSFSSSRSLLNISSVFLIHAPILFLRFWIIFTVSTLNSFSGRLAISSSLIWSLVIAVSSVPYFWMSLFFFFDQGVVCISVLLIVWPKASSTGVHRQLGGTRCWYQDGDLWGICC